MHEWLAGKRSECVHTKIETDRESAEERKRQESKREREKQRETASQTDRQTGRQADRQTGRQADRQSVWESRKKGGGRREAAKAKFAR